MIKYENWSKVLIEPSSLNDARLYALESRIHQEEDIRVKEYEFLQDFLKKLIYSIESEADNKIDANESTNLLMNRYESPR